MDIGIVGLGKMGAAIAERFIEAGHEVTVWNRSPEKAKALLGLGATLAHDVAGTANGDMVITILADDRAVEEVVFGTSEDEQGLLAHQGEETVHVSMSTISAQLTRRISEVSIDAEKAFIAAPVMGRPDVAERGELIVMPAGKKQYVERCRPAFELIGKSVNVLGDKPEQAAIAKLAANFMISSMIETMSEAFALLRKNDVDHQKFLQVMAGEFFNSPIYQKYGKIMVEEKFESGAFSVLLQEKDTRLVLEAAIESQVPMPFAAAVENAFLTAIGRGKGTLDPCVLAQIAAENAGVKTKSKK